MQAGYDPGIQCRTKSESIVRAAALKMVSSTETTFYLECSKYEPVYRLSSYDEQLITKITAGLLYGIVKLNTDIWKLNRIYKLES